VDAAKRLGHIPQTTTVEEVMAQTVPVVDERVNPGGVVEAFVARRGENEIVVELPKMSPEEADQVEQRIMSLGSLEMRIVATTDYAEAGITFKLDEEKKRLEEWLKVEANKKLVLEDPINIAAFHSLGADKGGRLAGEHLAWFPRKIRRDFKKKDIFDPYVFSQQPNSFAVAVFTPEEMQAGPDARRKAVQDRLTDAERSLPPAMLERLIEERTFVLEYVPVNMHEEYFKGEHLNAAAVRYTIDPDTGGPAVGYEMTTEHKSRYADFSQRHRGKASAIILNRYLHSAPVFQGRIFGPGIIHGQFTEAEAKELVKILKTGSLQVKPVRTSKFDIGPQLGARAIYLGKISIGIGAAIVLAFIILYYRTVGLVAFFGLSLNVFILVAIMLFIRATWTLPGLAGIVLTIGMSVDSNILIYERIKEEVKKGKQLLQAVAAGFDRALGVIIDTHVTTFLSGLVLYQVGLGPIKGFAVGLL
jgi:protein-export membrane protein SecD